MRFERLARGHVVAAVAALVLLLVMAMDWYGTHEADQARQVANSVNTTGAEAGETGRAVKADAEEVIARDEKNAWQEARTIDRLLLFMLLLTIFLALFTAAYRAAGKRPQPPWTPSTFTALSAAVTALLLAYRILNQPGDNANTTVKIGAPLALVVLAIVGWGATSAFKGEAAWAELRQTAAHAEDPQPAPANHES